MKREKYNKKIIFQKPRLIKELIMSDVEVRMV